ncbi:Translation initiation factor 2 subunit alpha [uncultured archaeon]|nr:Translation initiation factor 2 subunit alpha [uncultured archaeon]
MNDQFEEGELVLCTVDKVIGTTVFVKVDGNGDGTITTSEIAPGRIRNLRDYVVPNKKIVCKILRIQGDKIQLSLRRVKPNERKDLLERIEKEKSYKAVLKTVLGEDESKKLIEKILSENTINDFFLNLEENKKFLENEITKEQFEKLMKIFESKKEKPKQIKQIFRLSNKSSNGMVIVKNILKESCQNNCNISYLAAGKYSITLEGKDLKEIDNNIQTVLEKVEQLAKKEHCDFVVEKS